MIVPEDKFKAVAQLVMDAAGLKTASNDRRLADMAEERETAMFEAQQHLAELKRNEALQAENDRLAELKRNEALQAENDRLAELNAHLQESLEAEKASHNALKLRVFDVLLAEKDSK